MENNGNSAENRSKSSRTVSVSPEISAKLEQARKEKNLTQLELSSKSTVSLRTIRDLESGRRKSFSESTLIHICRVLDIRLEDVLEDENAVPNGRRLRITAPKVGIYIAIGIVVMGVAFWFTNMANRHSPARRVDWITLFGTKRLHVDYYTPEWGSNVGAHVNYVHLKQIVSPGEEIEVAMKWSYHFIPGSRPVFFVSAFGIWDPDTEIRVFDGVLSGDSTRVDSFKIQCPPESGVYPVRIFFASAYGPMSSYFGRPWVSDKSSQLEQPCMCPYAETMIEVVDRGMTFEKEHSGVLKSLLTRLR